MTGVQPPLLQPILTSLLLFMDYYTRGIQKVLRQILKKNSEYGNQIESCKYSHLIWLPYSEIFFFKFVLELFEYPSYISSAA